MIEKMKQEDGLKEAARLFALEPGINPPINTFGV